MQTYQRFSSGVRLLLLGVLLSCQVTACAAEPEIQPATFQGSPSTKTVTFRQQPARVGDSVSQRLAINLEINTKVVQSGQIANQDKTTLRKRQQRHIEAIEVAEGRVRRARVTFPHSRLQSPDNQDPTQLKTQAVEGKSYLVERQGERLLVTDLQGAIPTQAEFEIVVASVQTLGLPSPLAQLLNQRTLRVGDRLEVPKKLAEQIMGFGDQLGQVQKFEMELKSVQTVDGQICALFGATIEIRGDRSSPLEVDIEGQVTIQTETCRTVEARFSGPLQMTASEQSYQLSAEGGLQMAILSQYGSTKR